MPALPESMNALTAAHCFAARYVGKITHTLTHLAVSTGCDDVTTLCGRMALDVGYSITVEAADCKKCLSRAKKLAR